MTTMTRHPGTTASFVMIWLPTDVGTPEIVDAALNSFARWLRASPSHDPSRDSPHTDISPLVLASCLC